MQKNLNNILNNCIIYTLQNIYITKYIHYKIYTLQNIYITKHTYTNKSKGK
jgi:hypothetical protein